MSSASAVTVLVSGAGGKMGREVVKTVLNDPDLTLVAAVDKLNTGQDAATVAGMSEPCGIAITGDLKESLANSGAQVCVDFTHPEAVLPNALAIIEAGCRPVIGTTGLSPEDLGKIRQALETRGIGGMVVPNFAIGAVLLMKFAEEASKYLDHAEIIELHHNQKADAPSGTAIKTAEKMLDGLKASGREAFGPTNAPEKETYPGARGGKGPGNIQIHSVRLPGLVAHQEVLFGGPGQILTIRHDSIDRTSFMPGVALACKKVLGLSGLVYGLEHIL